MVDSSSIQSIRQHVSDKVRALMARHGVSDARQQLSTLMSIMEASHSQVYRKISGRSSWLEEDLLRIAQHYGETLGTLFRDELDPCATTTDGAPWHKAKVQIAEAWLDCQVTLAAPPTGQEPLVLVNTPEGPRVHTRAQAAGARPAAIEGAVAQLHIDAAKTQHGGFAVLDDDPDVADSIVDHLLLKGLEAQAFYAKDELLACARRFDTYILDWYSSATSTTGDLVQHLRSSHAPKATIVILTGQIQRDQAESELARLIHSHDVMVELKPMRLDLLLAKIEHKRPAP